MNFSAFSSEEDFQLVFMKTTKDISFEATRWPFSLEEHFNQKKLEKFLHFLITLKNQKQEIIDFMNKNSTPKKELFLFLLEEPPSQKKFLKQNPEFISQWINSKIRVEDLFPFEQFFPHWQLQNLIQSSFLDPKTVIVFMPHLFLSLADEQIINSVFATEGFDPYFTTEVGNNLFHSFLFFRLPYSQKPVSKKALQLLIDKSPPELLTQQNQGLLSPITFAIHFNHFFIYDMLIKALPSKSFINEIPFLEKAILFTGLYEFIEPIYNFFMKKKITNLPTLFLQNNMDSIYLEMERSKNLKTQASFMSLEKDVSIVKFNLKPLFLQNKFQPYIGLLKNYQMYEHNRIVNIISFYQNPTLKNIADLYEALFTRDIKALQTAYQKIIASQTLSPDLLAHTILEESIRSQFKQGVLQSINNLKNIQTVSYNPLFFALLNYASLSEQHPRKKVAKNIIKHLTTAIKQKLGDIPINYISFMILFNTTDILEFFLKEKTVFTLQDIETLSYYAELSLQEDQLLATQILNNKLEEFNFKCREVFIQ